MYATYIIMFRSLANFQREFPQTDYQKHLKYFGNKLPIKPKTAPLKTLPPVTKTVVVNPKKRKRSGPLAFNPPKKMKSVLSSQKRRSSLGSLTKLFKKSKI